MARKQVEAESKAEEASLYEVLDVLPTASQAEIRRAYHKMALKLHPDKNPGDEDAKERFQTVQRVFGILRDPVKRKLYDETGATDDTDFSSDSFKDLYEYYRSVFKKVSLEDIESAELAYRGSEEESRDLKELYTRFKGDMDMLFNWLICSIPDLDSHRHMETINEAILSGELKEYKAFKKWAAKISKKPAPVDPLRPRPKTDKSKTGAGSSDLTALIRSRQQSRSQDLFSSLEAKYAKPAINGRKRSKRDVADVPLEPSEEEFQAARERVVKGKLTRKSKK